MNGYVTNIEEASLENDNFRHVVYTGAHSQLVLMSLVPGEEIGEEIHSVDQFIRCDEGEGIAILDGAEYPITDGFAILVPSGARHNIINTSTSDCMKLTTLYAPPDHKDGTIHVTKADAEANEEHFDGVTSE